MNSKNYTRIHLNEVGSTNDYAKRLRGEKRGLIITAIRQTGGRGTKGRSFCSEEGGVYLTKLAFPERFLAKDAFQITMSAAVAVCETLKFYGLQPKIKWPNDVHVQGKKICGILIENTLSGEYLSSAVIGVGLNVYNRLPSELLPLATTMKDEGASASVEEVVKRLIAELAKERGVEEYTSYLGYMGEGVTLILGEERLPATLLSVTERGELQAEVNGEIRCFSAGEVSLRL